MERRTEMGNHHGMTDLPGMLAACKRGHTTGRFGRMFSDLPPLYTNPATLLALGGKGGPMDGGVAAIKTTSIPVGEVFFGQFIDHDITLDITSSFDNINEPADTPNIRTPTLDLDSVYGDGPEAMPFLFHAQGADSGIKLLTGAEGTATNQPPSLAAEDLPRSAHGRAIIGDPRNDENRVLSQMQLGFLRFHNKIVDHVRTEFTELSEAKEIYEKARTLTTWHYQWVVVNDFLPTMVGKPLVDDILGNGRKIYRPEDYPNGEPFIPVEFAVAAYRFGHSMVPQRIQIQSGKPSVDLFGPTLGTGFVPIKDAAEVVEWAQLLPIGATPADELAEKLDAKMASDLLELPFIPSDDVQSLAARNLLRGLSFLLPSGEQVAKAMARPDTEIAQVRAEIEVAIQGHNIDLSAGTPLWFYILVEGATLGRETSPSNFDPGEGLGPVGGRIVAEVLIGLLELDGQSYLGSNRSWHPDAAKEGVGVKTVGELLAF
jgi:hypothetical protein